MSPAAENPTRFSPLPLGMSGRPPSEPIVFCLDDETEDAHIFQRLLQQPGLDYASRLFTCGEEMLDALLDVLRGATPPLACFVDVKMAGMSGLDVLRWIRCQRALDSIPVIMLSSSEDPEQLLDARVSGAQCYVAKYPTPAQLRDVLLEAEHYSAAHSSSGAFQLTCNLLLGTKRPRESAASAEGGFTIRIAGDLRGSA